MANDYRACCETIGTHIKQRIQEEYPTSFRLPLKSSTSTDDRVYVIKERSKIFGRLFGKKLVRIDYVPYADDSPGYGISVFDFKLCGIVNKAMHEVNQNLGLGLEENFVSASVNPC